ncbi:hypothetical protein PAHAL_6G070700 [Panicum hallii]|uniref:Uncharacterized protein n=1 Tax=Panicum hallii TaxID=206008 RepID=A0A2T8IFL9_9POAL|nr:hypothetical protein PAHAL_6G070700 [Panicum hallii]
MFSFSYFSSPLQPVAESEGRNWKAGGYAGGGACAAIRESRRTRTARLLPPAGPPNPAVACGPRGGRAPPGPRTF